MKNYEVTLFMSEKYNIITESEKDAIRQAKNKLGCDYLIDKIEVREEKL